MCGLSVLSAFILIFYSCMNDSTQADYDIDFNPDSSYSFPLLQWEVCGPLSEKTDSKVVDSLLQKRIEFPSIHRSTASFLNNIYIPRFNQADLKELYNINPEDSVRHHTNEFSLMRCTLNSSCQTELFLELRHLMPMTVFLNGDSLSSVGVEDPDIYPLQLREGHNELLVKASMDADALWWEAFVCDSTSMASRYVARHSGKIIYPLISRHSKRILLTDPHANVSNLPVSLRFTDVRGEEVASVKLQNDSLRYTIPELEPEQSYLCELRIGDAVARQPVCCSNADDSYARLVRERSRMDESDFHSTEIDQLLYRFRFLLSHPSRTDDWWWQFKIGQLVYESDRHFPHVNDGDGHQSSDPNIRFVTYRSGLDGGIQRYLLPTPNPPLAGSSPLPLVVVIRPDIEIHRHFLTCPQIARQWAVNYLQELSCRYGYAVMMPEMRTYLNEELTPMAEAELMLAIEDVGKDLQIDPGRIYLHANCSGAFRTLQLAERNPGMFAALGLYAPLYERTEINGMKVNYPPSAHLENLRDIPVMIHYDPLDGHSPSYLFKDLIRDCRKEKIPLTLSVKRNSGELYNVALAGEEAFEFFRDKRRKSPAKGNVTETDNKEKATIADFYARPFVYVYDSSNKSEAYKAAVDSIREEYDDYFFSTLPLRADTSLTTNDLKKKNLFLIGDSFKEKNISQLMKKLHVDEIMKKAGGKTKIMYLFDNPLSKGHHVIVYHLGEEGQYSHSILRSWQIFVRQVNSK